MRKNKLFVLLTALLLIPLSADADGLSPQIVHVAARNCISLDGQWKYIVDPYGIGYQSYHLVPLKDHESFFADRSFDTDRTKLVEYAFDRCQELRVPGDWNTQYEKLYYYEGAVWYRRTFDFYPQEGKRYFLYFGAVNYVATVALNGHPIARHEGGYTPFNVEVTGKLRPGSNSVVVLVDNTRRKDGIPTDNSDWWNYGGITRSVRLVEVPRTFIRDYSIQLDKTILKKASRKKAALRRIYGQVRLDGPVDRTQVRVRIPELGVDVTVQAAEDGTARFEAQARPELWTPEVPKRYDVEISSGGETIPDKIGFRYIETEGDKILLNGQPVFLRGISIHEEAPRTSSRITSAEECRELLGWAKELGCNFVRLAHYPHNEEMVRLAEEMGLMVWSEIPVYWTISWSNPSTFACAMSQLEEMITRDVNRCNIVIWSIANETPVSPARTLFLSRLIARTREMDPTRLVSAAMEKTKVAPNQYTVDDPLLEYTDLISFNQYTGWYSSGLDDCDVATWTFPVRKPVFISEFGAGALYGLHGPVTERFTEEYMAECYRRNIRMMEERMSGFAGTTPWILKDFRSPRRALAGIQDDFNRKGVLSDKGEKKQAFYVLQDWYSRLKK